MKSRSIEARTLDCIREQRLLTPGETVLCAVSGGADSMALLTILSALAEELQIKLCAAHYDHRLRGQDAARDAAFVADWCAAQGIPCRLGSGDVAGEAVRLHQGVEETARALRYAFLEESADALGAGAIATAHHAGDNAETVLLHLLRGSGLDGLCGIPPKRGRLIRPLLPLTREELAAYLQDRGIPHVEDLSNADPRYARNRLRQQVLPVLRELNPGFLPRLTANLGYLQADRAYLEEQAGRLSQQAREEGDGLSLPAQALADAPRPLALRAVKQLLARLGRHQVSAVHLEAVLSLCTGENPSARCPLPQGWEARRVYDRLYLTPAQAPPAVPEAVTLPGPGRWQWGDWTITAAPQGEGWRFGDLTFPLTLRPRAPGDALQLPGRRTRTLKKWLIDAKIPQLQRDGLPVLSDAGGILAVGGLGPHAPRLDPAGPWAVQIERKEGHTL